VNITRRDDTRDIQVTLGVSEEALTAYNERYNKSYRMYPQNLWRFETDKVTIKKGTTGIGANIVVQPLTPELAATGDIYVMPVAVAEADEGVGILHGADAILCKIKSTPVVTVCGVPATDDPMYLFLPHPSTADEPIVCTDLTIEFLIKLTTTMNAHNFALLVGDGGVDGGGQVFSRIEGGGFSPGFRTRAEFEWNIGDGNAISVQPTCGIEPNKWYHIAFTFGNRKMQIYMNGKLAKSLDIGRKDISWYGGLKWEGAAFNTYYRPRARNSVMWSELRVWETIRTPDELEEYMYSVNPQTPGLMGYWKMNDGPDSQTIKDYAHGNDGIVMKINAPNNDDDRVPATQPLTWYADQNITVGQ
jgi:hypothetical protein